MRKTVLLAILATIAFAVQAQQPQPAEDKEAAYTRTITERARKIVSTLKLTDSIKAERVIGVIADQYRGLNEVYTERDERVKQVKAISQDKRLSDSAIKLLEETFQASARKLHEPFLNKLSKDLTADQVTMVKDGMTYNVLTVTYKAMQDMIPTLKQHEKDQIMAWLVEAREYAMDAESSDKKHWWFGKYKGRINNYLSAQGYDLQGERKAWEERIKAQKAQKTSTQQ